MSILLIILSGGLPLTSTEYPNFQKLTRSAEGSARFYTTYDDSKFNIPQDESVCAKFEQLLNDSDVRVASNSAARLSGVHVNIESYRCDPKVIRDFSWTGAESVEKAMTENKRAPLENRTRANHNRLVRSKISTLVRECGVCTKGHSVSY
ncbi:VWA protein [Oesophagostomum dentatum]|uniref:VWA protein n=1 Tax=Oesophagostomum dentatum TaxID=61180 RepID=A0A0B1SUK3_OESDE|nr:VWA protein [Oesophagostomum dentatum]